MEKASVASYIRDLIYDWNKSDGQASGDAPSFVLFDETLRDGIQAPYVDIPDLEQKFRFIDHMIKLGIESADLGYPGASKMALDDCKAIARYIRDCGYSLIPAFAGRTHKRDIDAICDVSHYAGCSVDAYLFVAVSPIRQYIEGWDYSVIERSIKQSAWQCKNAGVNFVLVLEDSLRCAPDVLARIYSLAIDLNVQRITLCDTIGCALPSGAREIILWSKAYFAERGHNVAFDWHGHNDRGSALTNALTAIKYGCHRIHGTILGIGERAGNTALDQLIVNCHLINLGKYNLSALKDYCDYASTVLDVKIPVNYPAVGRDVFKTSAGVHASAILKAHNKGETVIKDIVYSSIPASFLGREQEIQIDSSSGISNVLYWLQMRGHNAETQIIDRILGLAKASRKPLSDQQIENLLPIS